MRLIITEPARVIADHDDVVSVRAEDASGSFGILPGHADLITVMTAFSGGLATCRWPAGLVRRASRRAVGARWTRSRDRHTPSAAWQ